MTKTYPLASKPLGILNTSRLFFAIPICDLFINKCSFFISKLDLKNRFWDPHLILMFGCFCNAAKIRMLEGTLSDDVILLILRGGQGRYSIVDSRHSEASAKNAVSTCV